MTGKKKIIIIVIAGILVILAAVKVITNYSQKHRDVLKDAQVQVTVEDDSTVVTRIGESQEDVALDLKLKEERGFGESTVDYVPGVITEETAETPEGTDSEESVESSESEEGDTSETQEYVFGYTSIDMSNYVNFIEQLCSVDFNADNIDTSVIPLSEEVRQLLETQGCVSEVALNNGFITTDNGYNDEKNSFFVVLHTPNEGVNYVLVEGYMQGGSLVDITITEME